MSWKRWAFFIVFGVLMGNSGRWAGIVIEVANRKYFVYTESVDLPTPKTVGRVAEVGRTVQVFYTRIENSLSVVLGGNSTTESTGRSVG